MDAYLLSDDDIKTDVYAALYGQHLGKAQSLFPQATSSGREPTICRVDSRKAYAWSPIIHSENRFLVLNEYDILRDRIRAFWKSHSNSAFIPPIDIRGSHGIGKTMFLLYLLVREAADSRPVVFYTRSTYYLFMSNGSYASTRPYDFRNRGYANVIALVDADGEDWPSPHLVYSGLRIIVTGARSQAGYLSWVKDTDPVTFVMNPPGKQEIVAALRLRPDLQAVDETAILEAITDYGYNMRIINSVLSKMVSTTADNVVCKAIRRLTLPIVQAIFSDPDSVPIDISNALVTSYRLGGAPLEDNAGYFKSDATFQIISTAHLYRRIYVEFLRQSRTTSLEMYDAFLPRYPRHAPTARQLFDIWAHDQLCRGGNIKLRVMRDDKRRLWRDPTPLASTISLDLKPMPCRLVARGETLTATPPYARKTYHIASASDNPSFSAFFMTDKYNVVVQTTLASRLDLNVDGFRLASEHFANLRKDLDTRPVKDIYVLVVPSRKDVVSAANPADEWLDKFIFATLTLDTANEELFWDPEDNVSDELAAPVSSKV